MILREVMNNIESHTFSAYVNIASDLKTFLLAVQDQEAVQKLKKKLSNPDYQLRVLIRIEQLCRQSFDPRYANPWDTALAVYTWLLSLYNIDLARIAAEYIVKVPQSWWARRIAIDLLFKSPEKESARHTTDRISELIDSAFQSLKMVTQDTGEQLSNSSFISNIANVKEQIDRKFILRNAPTSGSLYYLSHGFEPGTSHDNRTEETDDPIIEATIA